MAEQPKQPKKPQRSRAKKLKLDVKKRWQDIINNVDKQEVPITVLECMVIKLVDGSDYTINVKDLLAEGIDADEVENMLNDKISSIENYIQNIDFFVDVDKVVDAVQPETDKVLKGL